MPGRGLFKRRRLLKLRVRQRRLSPRAYKSGWYLPNTSRIAPHTSPIEARSLSA